MNTRSAVAGSRWALLLPALLLCAGAWLAASLTGCTTPGPQPPNSRFQVTVPKAPFYKYGPAQTFGADFSLNQGQRVTMLERSFGYSRVMLADGQSGYVATEELGQAPPDPPAPRATPEAKRRGGMFTAKRKRSNVQPVAEDPLFDVNDVPLPMVDNPSSSPAQSKPVSRDPKPAPGFRY